MRSYIVIAAAALVSAFGLHWTSRQYASLPQRDNKRLSAPPLSSLSPAALKIITLGHDDIYNDIWIIWATQILSDQQLDNNWSDMQAIVDSLLQQRPPSERIYHFTCLTLLHRFHRPEHCERVILAGLRRFPKSWNLPVVQAYLFANQLREPHKAASYYLLAASRPDAPPYMQNLALRLAHRESVSEDELGTSLDTLMAIEPDARFKEMVDKLKTKKERP